MIIVRLIGGLGNQMFQYSLGRTMSLKWHSDLYLDVTSLVNPLPNNTPRSYELDKFHIKANIASSDLLKWVSFSRIDTVRFGIRSLFSGETVFKYIKEKTHDFDREILSLPDNVYLNGYWQSEKYFNRIPDIIRKDLSFVNPPSAINQEVLEEIVECNSVSVHIRRGDYVSNPKTRDTHGVIGSEYYGKALNLIDKKVKEPEVFVFSDDIQWARENLKTELPLHFIDHNGMEKGFEDLRLMSHCKHHIIANSSFSWWGAWLGKRDGQVVVSPARWFNTRSCNFSDRLPSGWVVVN